jgi:endo-1,4-beta-xylanase
MKGLTYALVPIAFGIALFHTACGDGGEKDNDTDTFNTTPDAGVDGGGVAEILLIEDFDDGDNENALGGIWITYDDSINNGDSVVTPTSVFEDGVFEASAPGFDGGLAAHITGTTGNMLGWDYLGVLTSLNADALCPEATPTDISEYDGIQFVAKGSLSNGSLVFKLPHKMDGEAGNCVTNPVSAESLTAYCDYELDFKDKLSETWSLVRIRFEELEQPTWGDPVPLYDVLTHAKELVWQVNASDAEVDLWVDNVALFKDIPGPDDVYPKTVVESTEKLTLYDASTDFATGTVTDIDVDDQSFEIAKQVETDMLPKMIWDVSLLAYNETVIKPHDLLHVTFSTRCVVPPEGADTCRMNFLFQKDDAPYTHSAMFPVTVGDTWTTFSYPFLAAESYDPKEAVALLMMGFPAQTIAVGDFAITNYGDTEEMENLSKTEITYDGRKPDAAWREAAEARIDTYRKGNLTVIVKDADGNPVPDATVAVTMTRHRFGFGTAINTGDLETRLTGDDKDRYAAAIPELFNTVVPENTLKWKALAGDWGDDMGMDLATWGTDWAEERDLDVKGHVLVWPGWGNLPEFLKSDYESALEADGEDDAVAWLTGAVEDHIQETVSALTGRLAQWDVINEPFDNHDLMDILGEEAMEDWFRAARAADPDAKLFINDYSILNRKTTYSASRDNLQRIVADLIAADAPVDGIGLQAHFEEDLTAMNQVYEILESFVAFDKDIWVTEFDLPALDPELAADYTRDFMTMLFSHPAAAGFVMWGFWDGNHFGPFAPIYESDWTEKPSGKVYEDLVFKTWWTDEKGTTDSDGTRTTRAFFGNYTVTVTNGNEIRQETITFSPDSPALEITL